MKKLVAAVALLLLVIALATFGCTNKNLVGPSPGAEGVVVSSCVTCHTDKDTLKAVASPEEETKSEATTGEG
jgi:hypothetical protein